MKLYDGGIIVLLVIVAVAAVVGVSSYFIMGPDNPIEEAAEQVIEKETGINLDLSPKTPESPKASVSA